ASLAVGPVPVQPQADVLVDLFPGSQADREVVVLVEEAADPRVHVEVDGADRIRRDQPDVQAVEVAVLVVDVGIAELCREVVDRAPPDHHAPRPCGAVGVTDACADTAVDSFDVQRLGRRGRLLRAGGAGAQAQKYADRRERQNEPDMPHESPRFVVRNWKTGSCRWSAWSPSSHTPAARAPAT